MAKHTFKKIKLEIMINELMKHHHEALSILRIIKVQEGKIKVADDKLKDKGAPNYQEKRYDYIHDIDVHTKSVKRLFERYTKIIIHLNNQL